MRERNKIQDRQVMHHTVTHHPLIRAQPSPGFQSVCLVFVLGMMLYGVECPFG